MKNILSMAVFVFALIACQSNAAQSSEGVKTLPVIEYNKLLSEKKELQLIDVRTPGEYAEGHLVNAVNMDYNAPNFEQQLASLDKNKATFIYCLSGGRSGNALSLMASKGFKEVYNLKGGILQWKAEKLPLSSDGASSSWKGMSEEEYNRLISGDIPVLVDFKAKWCGPCKQLTPILAEIQKEYDGKIKIVAIDIDDNKSLAEKMSIRNIPLLIYHKNGKVIMNQEGFMDKEGLIKLFKL